MDSAPARPWRVLPVILAAVFMYGFDANVVNVAIPSLQHDLRASPAALELVVGGYAFSYAAGLLTGARLGDLYGQRRLFLIGVVTFTATSLGCGLAQTSSELVVARLLQGLSAAAMVPQVLAVITTTFSSEQRPRALGWFGVVGALSGICGQVLGGLLLVANVLGLGWRGIFLLNLPLGAVVFVAALRVLPRRSPARRGSLDPVGAVAITGALALALAPLTLGHQAGWPVWCWLMLAAAVPCFAAALVWERRLAAAGRVPLLDLTLFTTRSFRSGLIMSACFMGFFTSSVFVSSLLLQDGLGLSALDAGLAFAPMAVLGLLAPPTGRRLLRRYGQARVIVIGALVSATGDLLLVLVLHAQRGGVDLAWLITGLAIIGLGNILLLPAVIGSTLALVDPHQAGAASGTLNTVQQFAGSAGLAIIGAVFFTALGSGNPDRTQYAAAAEAALWCGLVLLAVLTLEASRPRRSAPQTSSRPMASTERT